MSHSQVRAADAEESNEDVNAARSRSRSRARDPHAHVAAGRGGIGNVRTSSVDPSSREREAKLEAEEKAVGAKYQAAHEGEEHASGRGGFGNVPHHHHAEGPKA